MLAPPRAEYVECYAAMARLGVTVVGLNTRAHPDELVWCIGRARPSVVIADGAFAATIADLRQRCPTVGEWICLDGTTQDSTPYAEILVDGPLDAEFPTADDIHNILFTSGTTGRPKGAMISQAAAATRAHRIVQWFGLTENDGFVGWLPLFHCGGDESLYATLASGGRFAAFGKADVVAMYRRIESERLTWTLLLPGVITVFLENPRVVTSTYAPSAWPEGTRT
ncbi:AMP-binding protein [Gordonia asplenii]|uniref:AMP-binding protein n=1 Tax=Gordonia asplenii TaxID=2725283 RepID=UPI002483CDEB|nr:class I adenylate-forming enzyme family protein [Gordonia asplenii]